MLQITDYRATAEMAIVDLSLRAWAPVFESMRTTVGDAIFNVLYPDWEPLQAKEVRETLANPEHTSWVATEDGVPVGFATAGVLAEWVPNATLGQIVMVAVDPESQRQGIGRRLTDTALAWFRKQGVTIAAVETGGDPGHAPARATYERSGFTALPIARYFQVL